jgi:hypothetical protein
VVLKAEFAQSYIAQPKISFLSLVTGWSATIAMLPPGKNVVVIENTGTGTALQQYYPPCLDAPPW